MSKRFEVIETPIKNLLIIERKPIIDNRGFFSRFFCANDFKEMGIDTSIAQMNHTFTSEKGAVRGLHYQLPPFSEVKIVSCLRGKIFDVAIDLRQDSATFLQWQAEILSAKNHRSLYIPEGFAHGFQTLEDNCELIYIHSKFYKPNSEAALNSKDTKLSIKWPLNITDISERDKNHPMIEDDFRGIKIT